MPVRALLLILMLLAEVHLIEAVAADAVGRSLERRFVGTVRPFVDTYCLDCHSKEKSKGDLDLSPYSTAPLLLTWQFA